MATLEDLRLEARLSMGALSRKAGIDIKTVRRALDGDNIQKLKAVAIVAAIAEEIKRPVKLEDVDGLHYI